MALPVVPAYKYVITVPSPNPAHADRDVLVETRSRTDEAAAWCVKPTISSMRAGER